MISQEIRQRVLDENRKHYNSEYADEYDLVHSQSAEHYSQRMARKQIQEIIGRFNGAFAVLDFGCGTGNLTLNFLRLSPLCRVTAVDIAQRVLDRLSQRVAPEERARIEFVATDVDALPNERAGAFEAICCSGALHHLPDYVSSVARLVDHAKPQVIYFALEPRPKSRTSKLAAALNIIDTRWHFCMVDLKLEGVPFHVRWLKFIKTIVAQWFGDSFPVRMLRKMLKRTGFLPQLYYEGKYNSQEAMKYVEFHDDGVDDEALRQVLIDRGYQVTVLPGADKHYHFFFRLSKMFKAPSHFTLIAYSKLAVSR